MPYPKLIFMRHGETEWNLIGRVQGILDSPLTSKGKEQAQKQGQILTRHLGNAEGYDQFVSPLGRTLQTAAGINKHFSLTPKHDDRLKEIAVGDIAGMTLLEIGQQFPEHLEGKKGLEWYFNAPGGETYAQVYTRAKSWLDSLKGPTIAVSHGQVGKVIRAIYCGLDKNQMLDLGEPQGVVHVLENGREIIWE